MKKGSPVLRALIDAALVAMAILATPCAVLSAYEIPFSVGTLALCAVLFGLCLSVWMHLERGGWIAGIVYFAVLVPLLLWKREAIAYGFAIFKNAMLTVLSPDVPFLPGPKTPVPAEGLVIEADAAVNWFVLLVMALLGLSIAWSLIRSKMFLLPLIVPLPIFMLSLIYTDLPVGHWTVFLLLTYLGCCLLAGGLRINDAKRYGLAAAVLLVFVLLLGALLRVVSPPETYEPLSFERRQEIIGEQLKGMYDDMKSALNNRVKRTEDLEDEEEWRRTDAPIMDVRCDRTGELYLRAYSLGRYENNAWKAVPSYRGAWASMTALGKRQTAMAIELSILSEQSEMLYVPYGFMNADGITPSEAYLSADGRKEYTWYFVDSMTPPPATIGEDEATYLAWATEQYTMPDGEKKDAFLRVTREAGLFADGDNYQTALRTAAFVRGAASYSVRPGMLPKGEDFVLYFLEQNKEGYCVHFASATTALLQAMGVPARYVFGYRFSVVRQNAWQTVTDEMAHAWTEVYCPGIGWVMVESTAGTEAEPEPTEVPETPTPELATPEPSDTPEPTDAPTTGEPDDPEPSDGPTETEEPENVLTPETPLPTDPTAGEPVYDPTGDGTAEPNDAPVMRSLNLWWLWCLLLPPALIGALWGIGKAVRTRRREAFLQKDARAAILSMYRYLIRLQRYGAPPSKVAAALAEEAAFSDHAMTDDRKTMQQLLKHAQATLKKHAWWKRLAYRWILFLDL